MYRPAITPPTERLYLHTPTQTYYSPTALLESGLPIANDVSACFRQTDQTLLRWIDETGSGGYDALLFGDSSFYCIGGAEHANGVERFISACSGKKCFYFYNIGFSADVFLDLASLLPNPGAPSAIFFPVNMQWLSDLWWDINPYNRYAILRSVCRYRNGALTYEESASSCLDFFIKSRKDDALRNYAAHVIRHAGGDIPLSVGAFEALKKENAALDLSVRYCVPHELAAQRIRKLVEMKGAVKNMGHAPVFYFVPVPFTAVRDIVGESGLHCLRKNIANVKSLLGTDCPVFDFTQLLKREEFYDFATHPTLQGALTYARALAFMLNRTGGSAKTEVSEHGKMSREDIPRDMRKGVYDDIRVVDPA